MNKMTMRIITAVILMLMSIGTGVAIFKSSTGSGDENISPVMEQGSPIITIKDGVETRFDHNDELPEFTTYFNVNDKEDGEIEVTNDMLTNVPKKGIIGEYELTLVISDSDSNEATKSIKISIVNKEAPTITTADDADTLFTDIDVLPDFTKYFEVVDNRGITIEVTSDMLSNVPEQGKAGVYQLTLEVTDIYENVSTKIIEIVVEDTTAPEITIATGAQQTFIDQDIIPDFTTYFEVNDNHDGEIEVTSDMLSNVPEQGVAGEYNLTLEVSDTSGNKSTYSIVITVINTKAPEITIVQGTKQTFTDKETLPTDFTTYFEVEDIDGNKIDVLDGMLSNKPEQYKAGVYNLTLIVSDADGNEAMKTIEITIEDTTAPEITIVPNMEINFTDQDTLPDFIGYFEVNDIHDGEIEVTKDMLIDIPQQGVAGTYQLTLTVEDKALNESTKTITITITDTPPTITIVPDMEINFTDQETFPKDFFTKYFEVNDVKDGKIDVIESMLSDIPQQGNARVYQLTITVTDTGSNTVTETIEITIEDTPPTITIVPNMEINFTDQETLPDFKTYFEVNDVKDGKIDVIESMLSNIPEQGKAGVYQLTITLIDTGKNPVTETITITIGDTPAEITIVSGTIVTFTDQETLPDFTKYFKVNDKKDGQITVTKGMIIDKPTQGVLGTHKVTIKLTDANGNESTETITITITDTPPEIKIASGAKVTFTMEDTLPDFKTYFEVTDVQDGVIVVENSMLSGIPQQGVDGTYLLTITVTDKGKNPVTVSETITITIEDKSKPEITIKSGVITEFLYNDILPDFKTYFVVNDNKDGIITIDDNMLTNVPIKGDKGEYVLTLTVGDSSGNISTKNIKISIKYIKPVITIATGKKDTFTIEEKLPNFKTYFAVIDYLNRTITVTEDMLSDEPVEGELGVYQLTITVTDESGNVVRETITITIEDTIAPEILVQKDEYSVVSVDWDNFLAVNDNDGTKGVIEYIESSNINFTQNSDSYTNSNGLVVKTNWKDGNVIRFLGGGKYTLIITVTDRSGNESTKEVVFNVSLPVDVNAPKLKTNMNPVVWNERTSLWEVVDENSDWYEYGNQEWANVHITSENLSVGDTVDETKLNLYVWIPRYKYNIPDANLNTKVAGETNIIFEKGTESTGISKEDLVKAGKFGDDYITHPAFTYGTEELTGFWMAKFEASGNRTTIESRPNVTGIRSISMTDAYESSKDQTTNNDTFENIETGLTKAEEWGAAAYLSNSKYGINKEITINSKGITGYAGGSNKYNSENGINASTTGNIYGIYDMSGGAWEIQAAMNLDYATNTAKYNNLENDINNGKITNLSKGTTLNLENSLGMALYETKGYYSDGGGGNDKPTNGMLISGGFAGHGNLAGPFSYYVNYNNTANGAYGFRMAIRVK